VPDPSTPRGSSRSGQVYRYRAEVLEQLWRHGVQPTERTRPELVHDFVSDLYRYELRSLRERLLQREFPKPEYYDRVVQVRNRYRLLAMRADEWLEK
jgi:hypothetical protein